MKTLYCLRHAKSSWGEPGKDDHERALSPRGVRAAELVAVYLAQRAPAPSFALCSTARRALDTLEPIRRRLGLSYATDGRLYLAAPDAIAERVAALDDAHAAALVVGHNPGLHAAALGYTHGGDRAARARLRERFPTAALAVLAFEAGSWSEVALGTGSLVEFVTPRDLV
ncbi:MAG: hypothetical protein DCC71_06845 [Proteobacteria bacterium]|nr:MAG: hypothetical protein DCC71_06845 [Pseudomonadota bacterium]